MSIKKEVRISVLLSPELRKKMAEAGLIHYQGGRSKAGYGAISTFFNNAGIAALKGDQEQNLLGIAHMEAEKELHKAQTNYDLIVEKQRKYNEGKNKNE